MTALPAALRWAPAVGWALAIFVISSVPDLRIAPEPTIDLVVRKVGHAAVFSILAILVHLALGEQRPRRELLAWVAASVYAVTDELHQAFVPGRGPSPADVAIDILGVTAGIAGLRVLAARRRA
jgi:VanZ family protein